MAGDKITAAAPTRQRLSRHDAHRARRRRGPHRHPCKD